MDNWMLALIALILADQGGGEVPGPTLDAAEVKLRDLDKMIKERKEDPRCRSNFECQVAANSLGSDVMTMFEDVELCKTSDDPEDMRFCKNYPSLLVKVIEHHCDEIKKSCG